MNAALSIQDAFKVNQAPYYMEDTMFGERRVYAPEAYSDAYMVRSTKTNQLCRYFVETEKGPVSAISFFGVKSAKDECKTLANMLDAFAKTDKTAFNQFLYDTFIDEVKNDKNLVGFGRKYAYTATKQTNPLAYTVTNFSNFISSLYCVINYPSQNGVTFA